MSKNTYYKWAFRFTILILIIQIVLFFIGINFDYFTDDVNQFVKTQYYLLQFSLGLFIGTILLLIVGFLKTETQNYQFWIAILICFGYIINLILGQLVVTPYVLF
jgi:hypothetical protein